MIVLNECRIDPEGKHLIIEAQVENFNYFDNVYIGSIKVDTNKTYSPNGPSDNTVFSYDLTKDKYANICVDNEDKVKHMRISISAKEMGLTNLDDNIFFVYIYVTEDSVPGAGTPCGLDNEFTMGVAVNLRPIYNMAMGYIKELNSNCSIPKGFIDMILRLKAFKLALGTGNYPTAFDLWDKLFKNKVRVSPKRGCGCNGIN